MRHGDTFRRHRAAITAAAVLTAVGAMAQDGTPAPVESTHLAGSVHMLRSNTPIGNPTTVLSVGEDGVFIADPNLLAVGDALREKIAELGGKSVRFVTCSHFHGDHAEGLENFAAGATVIAPRAQRARLASQPVVLGEKPLATDALPVLTFEERLTLHFNGEAIEIFTPPNRNGHTDGDAFVYFRRSGVLYVGDHLFLDRFPVVDLDNGGDLEGYLGNIGHVLATFPPETKIVPGHGYFPPTSLSAATLEHYRLNYDTLRESISFLRKGMDEGKGLDELKTAGLPEKFASFGERPRYVSTEAWIETVHRYYSAR